MRVDTDLALRAAGLQALLVIVVAVLLSLALPSDFFQEWGWISGPTAWLGCAAIVARRLTLPYFHTLIGAAFAGLPSLLAVALGLHWAGALVGVAIFGAWCGTLTPLRPRQPAGRRPRRPSHH